MGKKEGAERCASARSLKRKRDCKRGAGVRAGGESAVKMGQGGGMGVKRDYQGFGRTRREYPTKKGGSSAAATGKIRVRGGKTGGG